VVQVDDLIEGADNHLPLSTIPRLPSVPQGLDELVQIFPPSAMLETLPELPSGCPPSLPEIASLPVSLSAGPAVMVPPSLSGLSDVPQDMEMQEAPASPSATVSNADFNVPQVQVVPPAGEQNQWMSEASSDLPSQAPSTSQDAPPKSGKSIKENAILSMPFAISSPAPSEGWEPETEPVRPHSAALLRPAQAGASQNVRPGTAHSAASSSSLAFGNASSNRPPSAFSGVSVDQPEPAPDPSRPGTAHRPLQGASGADHGASASSSSSMLHMAGLRPNSAASSSNTLPFNWLHRPATAGSARPASAYSGFSVEQPEPSPDWNPGTGTLTPVLDMSPGPNRPDDMTPLSDTGGFGSDMQIHNFPHAEAQAQAWTEDLMLTPVSDMSPGGPASVEYDPDAPEWTGAAITPESETHETDWWNKEKLAAGQFWTDAGVSQELFLQSDGFLPEDASPAMLGESFNFVEVPSPASGHPASPIEHCPITDASSLAHWPLDLPSASDELAVRSVASTARSWPETQWPLQAKGPEPWWDADLFGLALFKSEAFHDAQEDVDETLSLGVSIIPLTECANTPEMDQVQEAGHPIVLNHSLDGELNSGASTARTWTEAQWQERDLVQQVHLKAPEPWWDDESAGLSLIMSGFFDTSQDGYLQPTLATSPEDFMAPVGDSFGETTLPSCEPISLVDLSALPDLHDTLASAEAAALTGPSTSWHWSPWPAAASILGDHPWGAVGDHAWVAPTQPEVHNLTFGSDSEGGSALAPVDSQEAWEDFLECYWEDGVVINSPVAAQASQVQAGTFKVGEPAREAGAREIARP